MKRDHVYGDTLKTDWTNITFLSDNEPESAPFLDGFVFLPTK